MEGEFLLCAMTPIASSQKEEVIVFDNILVYNFAICNPFSLRYVLCDYLNGYALQVPLYLHYCSQGQNAALEDRTHFTHTWNLTLYSLLEFISRNHGYDGKKLFLFTCL